MDANAELAHLISLGGVIDTPHAVFNAASLFPESAEIIVDTESVSRALRLLPPEALETYQDAGELDHGAPAGAIAADVLDLIVLAAMNGRLPASFIARLEGPCDADSLRALRKCGAATFAISASRLLTTIFQLATELDELDFA